MKKVLCDLGLVMCAGLLSACATAYPVGLFYTELKLPVGVTSNATKTTKVGVAECTSVLCLVATGDASIEAAKRQGGITTVTHVDWEVKNTLGIVASYKVVVYGN